MLLRTRVARISGATPHGGIALSVPPHSPQSCSLTSGGPDEIVRGPNISAHAPVNSGRNGEDHLWRRNPPTKLSVGMEATERLGWATGQVEASEQKSAFGRTTIGGAEVIVFGGGLRKSERTPVYSFGYKPEGVNQIVSAL